MTITELTIKTFESCGKTDKQAFEFIRQLEEKYGINPVTQEWWSDTSNGMVDAKEMRELVIEARKKGLVMADMGRATDLGFQYVSDIMRGKIRRMGVDRYNRMKTYLKENGYV